MNIGFYIWEPGLTVDKKTSSAGASWTRCVIDYYLSKGDNVYFFTDPAPAGTKYLSISDDGIAKLDVVLFYWRWDMPLYPERSLLYHDQWVLLYRLSALNIPAVVFDGDHKILPHEMEVLKHMGVSVYAPELFPREGVKQLIYPDPFKSEFPKPTTNIYSIVYIGNNYERYEQTKKLLQLPSTRFSVALFGNWLDAGRDGRESPEKVRTDFPHAIFPGRCPNDQVIKVLQQGGYTVHLFKPSYGETGFLTMRWLEAAKAGVPAFIPQEMNLPINFANSMLKHGLLVADGHDIADVIYRKYLSSDQKMLSDQRDFIYPLYRVEPWRDVLVAATDGGTL